MIKTYDVYRPLYENKDKFVILVTGGRGCEHPDTPIMMADLTIKKIKDIKVGDKVMGDDGTPRNVLNTMHGYSPMYRVKQKNADDYIVNDEHILVVRKNGAVVDMHIKDALNEQKLWGVQIGNIDWVKKGASPICKYSRITVEKAEECFEYNGIYIDGNHRYCHADGTVTHNSGKSFGVSTFLNRMTFEMGKNDDGTPKPHVILYTRYTMVSAAVSVIPEFLEKTALDGTAPFFHATKTDVVNTVTGARIMFRGINTSSGNQTAKLKSINGITTFVLDEAEELVDENAFDTIMLSIRQSGIQNRIIVIMNPTDRNHFIYKRYIKDSHEIRNIDGVPVQISTHPNVLHIHTSYLDNQAHLSEDFLKEALITKERDPEKYAHVFMGRWIDQAEGVIFPKWDVIDDFPPHCKKVALCADWGYSVDPTAIAKCGLIDDDLYIDELCYETGMLINDIDRKLKEVNPDGYFLYAESADPRLIQEIANRGHIIYPVAKTNGSIKAGIEKIKNFKHIYVTKRSKNMQEELKNYTWAKDKDGNLTDLPIDKFNHLNDAVRYYILGKILGQIVKARNVSKADLGIF